MPTREMFPGSGTPSYDSYSYPTPAPYIETGADEVVISLRKSNLPTPEEGRARADIQRAIAAEQPINPIDQQVESLASSGTKVLTLRREAIDTSKLQQAA